MKLHLWLTADFSTKRKLGKSICQDILDRGEQEWSEESSVPPNNTDQTMPLRTSTFPVFCQVVKGLSSSLLYYQLPGQCCALHMNKGTLKSYLLEPMNRQLLLLKVARLPVCLLCSHSQGKYVALRMKSSVLYFFRNEAQISPE